MWCTAANWPLARQWQAFSPQESRAAFCARAGEANAEAEPWFVLGGGRASSVESFTCLLLSYASEAGIDRAIARTASRPRQPEGLLMGALGWRDSATALSPDLPRLMGDLEAAAGAELGEVAG